MNKLFCVLLAFSSTVAFAIGTCELTVSYPDSTEIIAKATSKEQLSSQCISILNWSKEDILGEFNDPTLVEKLKDSPLTFEVNYRNSKKVTKP